MQQTTNTILMVRPINFRMNEQTAVNNYYQKATEGLSAEQANVKAQNEFDGFVEKLRNSCWMSEWHCHPCNKFNPLPEKVNKLW